MKMFTKEGVELMDILSLRREGDRLIIIGKMMGAMNASIYLLPKDVWKSLSLLSWSVVWYLPVILIKGLWQSLSIRRLPR